MERLTAPPTVFLNSFFALDAYIQEKNDLPDLFKLDRYEATHKSTACVRALGKLLLNAWSAEYALRITPVVNDEQYLQSSLHWTFPQGYYSVLFSARALLHTEGKSFSNESKIRKEVASWVMKRYYPGSLSFYTYGSINAYRHNRVYVNKRSNIHLIDAVQGFLSESRVKQLVKYRNTIQNDPTRALRSVATGEIVQHFGPEEYKEIAKRIGYTTYFDMLCRLRISSTNREIEQFIDSEIDVRAFHTSLVNIVSHINTVHEKYIAKAIGTKAYLGIINSLPSYLRDGFLKDRLVI